MPVDSSKSRAAKHPDAPKGETGAELPAQGEATPSVSKVAGKRQSVKSQGSASKAPAAANKDSERPDQQPVAQGLFLRNRFLLLTAMPSWLTSMVIHIIALLVLALVSLPSQPKKLTNELNLAEASETTDELDEFVEQELEPLEVEALPDEAVMPQIDTEVVAEEPVITPAAEPEAAPLEMEFDPLGEQSAPRTDLLNKIGAVSGTGLEGRGAAARSALVRQAGGTQGSEEAVARALKWFAAHQNSDGSWNLDHRFGPCQHRCRNPGMRRDAANGATALALLPYLGAGKTHVDGEFQQVVGAGLRFLLNNMRTAGQRGSLFDQGGNYYSHGLGAIVLCEAYAMTKDKRLMKPAQMAVYETAYAQDPIGGGWRYEAHQPGDTSALGWQLMALKSAHMAYLDVPPETYKGASKFLDSVQAESGAKYGYLDPGTTAGTTAVGLLCRMYLGWKRDNPSLERGVEFLKSRGPSQNDMYYNYYATQIMRHYGGDAWEVWNPQMRDYLVSTQSKTGHETGSWFFPGGGHAGSVGGRLYATSMATMILEVYYRHMPIYQQQAAEEDFPL